MTKRDLADLCLEGLLESTEQQQQVQLAVLLQAGLEYDSVVHTYVQPVIFTATSQWQFSHLYTLAAGGAECSSMQSVKRITK